HLVARRLRHGRQPQRVGGRLAAAIDGMRRLEPGREPDGRLPVPGGGGHRGRTRRPAARRQLPAGSQRRSARGHWVRADRPGHHRGLPVCPLGIGRTPRRENVMRPLSNGIAAAGAMLLLLAGAAAASGPPSGPVKKCAVDAVVSGAGCMDKYEASVWRVPDATTTNRALVVKIRQGTATVASLTAGGATPPRALPDDQPTAGP